MTRSTLDKELHELDSQIQQLGSLVDEALEKALEALSTGDLAQAGVVIEADSTIDMLRKTVEEHAIRLLTLQQPLGGRDLRYLTSALAIAGDLERTGDGAAGIAQLLLRMVPLRSNAGDTSLTAGAGDAQITEASVMRGLLDLGYEARRVLKGTMKAFAERDIKAAHYIWEEDDVVDVRYHLVRHDLMAMMAGAHAIPALQNDSKALQRATYLLWIAHKLERVADHCTNVCERLVFTIEGENDIQASIDKQ
ncbi:phosphate signaling complex protein PhoU [Dictyobacter arantiisoli]|uniref:Phosphate-specific transport system accessory protein PhoU n=1 Tax=Dictyobacter arantiisoli TaxID=2014874 RepID=A0A5A5TCY7_9CHLR|nr:phosphate signaling complex protein PhoU [Dictyobacter arantiisoli]GCF09065.1 phosphate transport system regulatory protein PhoU [Dictyobacter arantiisoli]